GVAKNSALLNLHLATGQIARPGAGPFSLTGQPNAMGGREAGGLAHLLPGYRQVTDPQHRAEVAAHWGIPVERLSPRPGYSALELFEAAAAGKVKALWIMCSNPAASMPNLAQVDEALRRAELVVVQDAYHPTDTSRYAHVLLPAAQWPEKEGVMTNSERRLTYLPAITPPPGEALPDWQIIARLAHKMGFAQSFTYASAAEVFAEFVALTRGRPCDYAGVSHERLQREGPLQWPCPAAAHPGSPRLYTGRVFPTGDGRACFQPAVH
ncbi:nitrate reductase, partial [Litorilinea aerophila]